MPACREFPRYVYLAVKPRRFRPPWFVDGSDTKLRQACLIIRDVDGHALAYVYFEDELGRAEDAFWAEGFDPALMEFGGVLLSSIVRAAIHARLMRKATASAECT
jgi:hypothetical protein